MSGLKSGKSDELDGANSFDVQTSTQRDLQVARIKLSDGLEIPQIGLGVLRIDNGDVSSVVLNALRIGYRHIDTAAGYGNEEGVGEGLCSAGFVDGEARKSLWLTTKLSDSEQGYDSTLRAFERQIAFLKTDYVDMYMIHWPTPFDWRSADTWRAFVELRKSGRVRTLGVCNFMPEHLERLHSETGEYPTVNQIELHPTWQQREVVSFCAEHGIAVQAYSPMARGADLHAGNGVIERIAQAHNISAAQVVLKWHIDNGIIIIPKSVHVERQIENLSLYDFELSEDEKSQIDALDSDVRAGHDPLTFSYS